MLVSLSPTRSSATEEVYGRMEPAFAEHAQITGVLVPEGFDPRDENIVQSGNVWGLCERHYNSLCGGLKYVWAGRWGSSHRLLHLSPCD